MSTDVYFFLASNHLGKVPLFHSGCWGTGGQSPIATGVAGGIHEGSQCFLAMFIFWANENGKNKSTILVLVSVPTFCAQLRRFLLDALLQSSWPTPVLNLSWKACRYKIWNWAVSISQESPCTSWRRLWVWVRVRFCAWSKPLQGTFKPAV